MVKPLSRKEHGKKACQSFGKTPRRHGMRLSARAGLRRLILMTDEDRIPDPVSAVADLPVGSIVILRDYAHPERCALAHQLRRACRLSGCWFLVAGDVRLARAVRADGLHMPEYMLGGAMPNRFGFDLVTAACHSRQALGRACRMGVDLALVSPVFPTASHPEARALGVHRFARMTEKTHLPIAALGGVTMHTSAALRGLRLAAVAGISGIMS